MFIIYYFIHSLVGKHVPPPISPILNLKSTTFSSTSTSTTKTTTTTSSSGSGLKQLQFTGVDNVPKASASYNSLFAWKLPSSTNLSETITTEPLKPVALVLPQRKVPALTPEPLVKKEKEIPREEVKEIECKNFFQRIEEFPSLPSKFKDKIKIEQGQGQGQVQEECENEKQDDVKTPVIEVLKVKVLEKVGGEINFLEDDGWLDGDNIDYSQNLFEDDDQYLSLEINEIAAKVTEINTTNPNTIIYDEIKAKDLLAERLHSSHKKDIWKRTENLGENCGESSSTRTRTSTNTNTNTSVTAVSKIKILKRPDIQMTKTITSKSTDINIIKNHKEPEEKIINSSSTETVDKNDNLLTSTKHLNKKKNENVPTKSNENVPKLVKKFSTIKVGVGSNETNKNLEIESVKVKVAAPLESESSVSASPLISESSVSASPLISESSVDNAKVKARIVYSSASKRLERTILPD